MAAEKRSALAARIRRREWMSLPGVFEMISARIADGMGFPALYITGYGTVASYLGVPDAGLATYTDMLDRVAKFAEVCKTPFIADGDTGYGGLLNVERTVQGYERAGAAGIQIEDQQFPKKCGHTPGRRVIALEEAAAKIRCAAESRGSKDFLIVARTDARGLYGIDEALKRGDAFAKAGADVLFIESPQSVAEMEQIGKAFKGKPLLANMVEGGLTPVLPVPELARIGYSIAIYPGTAFLAMGAALRKVYQHILKTGSSIDVDVPLDDFKDFSKLMGFEHVWDFEKKWAGQG
ncbi:MAG TPA: isocitrate lyase/PEP mutase family protein [Alphaproteobacteria bacterium]|jgi:2-methylisocitrate lyase-like PEP mutase family enzyme